MDGAAWRRSGGLPGATAGEVRVLMEGSWERRWKRECGTGSCDGDVVVGVVG
jgi:hypothetical protein